MRNRIAQTFPGQDFPTLNAELTYIADYTHQTQNVRGIEWHLSCPIDIDAFVVNNTTQHDITFCAFKENTIKVRNENTGEIKEKSHCEGIIFPTINNRETWTVLLELKYPDNRNKLGENLKEARRQLLSTLNLFREQGILEPDRVVHLIYSAPKYSSKVPFENWSMTPQQLKEIRRSQKAIMRGVNTMQILSGEALKV